MTQPTSPTPTDSSNLPAYTALPKTFRPMLSGKIANEADLAKLFQDSPQYHPDNYSKHTNINYHPHYYLASPKLDGIRVVIHPDARKGACTRTLKPIRNRQLHAYINELIQNVPEVAGLDGEITAGAHFEATSPSVFQDTTSYVMSFNGSPKFNPTPLRISKNNISSAHAPRTSSTFHVFDRFYSYALPDIYNLSYTVRNSSISPILEKVQAFEQRHLSLYGEPPPTHFKMLENVPLYSLDDLSRIEDTFLTAGFEGVMIRHPKRPYKFNRSALTSAQQHLIKLKRFEDAEGIITGFEELMHNDNPETKDEFGLAERSQCKANLRPGNTLGKVQIRVLSGDFEGVSCYCGSGFDQAQRQEIWNNQDKYLNKVINFTYQAIGCVDKPRIPIFKGFRED